MKAAEVVSWSGLALSLVGTVIAAIGIRQTWRQFHPEGARFWGPFYEWTDRRVRQPAQSFGRATKQGWNRLWGRAERRSITVKLGQAIETETAMPVTVVKRYANLPDPDDAKAFAAAVEKRFAELRGAMDRVEQGLAAQTTDREKAVDELQRQLDDQHDRLRDMTQQVAISGLPLEMTGVFLVVTGTVLQGIAQLIK